jgi:hypothetical protein
LKGVLKWCHLAESSRHVAESSSHLVESSSHLVESSSHLAEFSSHVVYSVCRIYQNQGFFVGSLRVLGGFNESF